MSWPTSAPRGSFPSNERAEYESVVLALELVALLQAESRALLATHNRR